MTQTAQFRLSFEVSRDANIMVEMKKIHNEIVVWEYHREHEEGCGLGKYTLSICCKDTVEEGRHQRLPLEAVITIEDSIRPPQTVCDALKNLAEFLSDSLGLFKVPVIGFQRGVY